MKFANSTRLALSLAAGLACARHPVMITRAAGLSRRARRARRRLSESARSVTVQVFTM